MKNAQLPFCGIDSLLADTNLLASLSNKKVALLTNQSALTQNFEPSAFALQKKLGSALQAILTPEHGWSGLVGEGIAVGDGFDPHLGLPVISLYGNEPRSDDFDVIIVDLQDVGLRCYTYGLTCAQLIDDKRAEFIVCDRPNPLGPEKKGPVLEPQLKSFVGHFEIPFQHGQTIGQILKAYATKSNLTVISCENFHRPYGYPWIPPSPNLPTWDSVLLYPGLVMLEGTNISEGRGTPLPFTSLGAPELDQYALVDFIHRKGLQARPITFTPQSGKLKGRECNGAHLIITDFTNLDAYGLGLDLLHYFKTNYTAFEWTPVKGADKDTFFIDYLLGSKDIRNHDRDC